MSCTLHDTLVAEIRARLIAEPIAAWHSDAQELLRVLTRIAPTGPSTKAALRVLGVPYSTVLSRLARAGLPSPKEIHSVLRLWCAARVHEGKGYRSVASVAYALHGSSPQSFSRMVRRQLGLPTRQFLDTTTANRFWPRVLQVLRPRSPAWARAAVKGDRCLTISPLDRRGRPRRVAEHAT